MFVLMLILVVAVSALSTEENTQLTIKNTTEECSKKYSLNHDEVMVMYKQIPAPANNPIFLKFFECFVLNIGVYENGKINIDKIKQLIPYMVVSETSYHLEAAKKANENAPNTCFEMPTTESFIIDILEIHFHGKKTDDLNYTTDDDVQQRGRSQRKLKTRTKFKDDCADSETDTNHIPPSN
ncbi:hypothetical protein RN001_001625 [Aquatica leii]|uniref:Uncharacterized protein n=1 Tax=Aquatica leii TaxID=1421715 RepID=A0AAN7PG58_9COLE|nr:hypothetical protein RN001_001625 [Aquatica leii]